jgi:tyrosine aminotransferase
LVAGATSIVQGALPKVLTPVANSADEASLNQFMDHYHEILRHNAKLCFELPNHCPALKVAQPKGAMYAMMSIDFNQLDGSMTNDEEFSKQLLQEENLIILPGACFSMPATARLVICPPADILSEAMQRITAFCARHKHVVSSADC